MGTALDMRGADLLVMALGCDQTRVFNLNLWRLFSDVRFAGEDVGYHQLTHDERVDDALGYQPLSQRFFVRAMDCWQHLLTAVDDITEGGGTLLDHVSPCSPTRAPSSPRSTAPPTSP